MRNYFFRTFLLFCLLTSFASLLNAQGIYTSIPDKIDKSGKYMFYLHGRIVEEQGVKAVHPEFGSYEYLAILDSLYKYGFNVISEVRQPKTNEDAYADKVVKQIDTLLSKGVPSGNIFVLGASKGAFITLLISGKAKNTKLHFIVLGTCSPEAESKLNIDGFTLCGNFLSIYEASDTYASSCNSLLKGNKCVTSFKEIKLTMNNKHGFLYKPYSEWLKPAVEWASMSKHH